MTSPAILQASASTRTEREGRQERFIRSQLDAMRELGCSPDAIKREEALLRGGIAAANVFASAFLGTE